MASRLRAALLAAKRFLLRKRSMAPSIKPGGSSSAIQTIKVHNPPTAPYVLTATVPLAPRAEPRFAVRKVTGSPTDWFPTDAELIAQSDGIDLWEVSCRVDSGSATSFALDDLNEPTSILGVATQDDLGRSHTPTQEVQVNTDALAILHSFTAVQLAVFDRSSNATYRVNISGLYTETKMWQAAEAGRGYHRNHRAIKTFYALRPVVPGGSYGYLHIFATAMADTPEIQFVINWTNGGCEERRTPGFPLDPLTLEAPPVKLGTDQQVPATSFGSFKGRDILFTRAYLEISPNIPPAEGFPGAWVMTPKYATGVGPSATGGDPSMNPSQNAIVRMVNTADYNKLHVIPLTFERPFRFAIAPSSVTPYQKHVVGQSDWSADLGGAAFCKGLGLPTTADIPAIDLASEATNCKARFAANDTWRVEPITNGAVPVSTLWPMSFDSYGGSTAGDGMWPHYGSKLAITAQKAALEILEIEQIRARCRTYGGLYNNLSGFPINPRDYASGGTGAPWRRFDRRFEKSGQTVLDLPFLVTRGGPRRMAQAAYNPGPRGGNTPQDNAGDPTPNVPDWYVGGVDASGTPRPVPGDELQATSLPRSLAITPGHTTPPTGTTDQSVPVLVQIQGASTFNNLKSVTFQITGTGELDIPIVESLTITGPASNVPSVQAKQTVGQFKTVTDIQVTAITGTLVSTELFTIGRASVGIADYNGADGITSIDCQHFIRMQSINRSLFLFANDPLAKLYLIMDGMDAMMTQWEGPGNAHRLDIVHNGAPGRGSVYVREFAWAMDAVASMAAVLNAQVSPAFSRQVCQPWVTAALQHYDGSFMATNNLFQMTPGGKEFKYAPYGSRADETEGTKVFWGTASREAAYMPHGLFMLANISWIASGIRASVKSKLRRNASGFKNMIWSVVNGDATGTHNYLPLALHYDQFGVLRPSEQGRDPNGTFVIFPTQANLPALNPVSGVPIRPAQFPPIDDDLYVAEIAGNAIVAGTPLTLLRNDSNSGGAGLLATQIRLTINGAATYNAKQRTFRILGTDPNDAVVDDLRYVDQIAGTAIVPGAALTLLNSDPGGVNQAREVEITLFGGATYTGGDAGKRRTFRIVGTNSAGSTITENKTCWGNGQPLQTFRSFNFFKTVTSITMLTDAQASALGSNSTNLGTLAGTELFRIGTPGALLVVRGPFNSGGTAGTPQRFRTSQFFKTVTSITMLASGPGDAGSLVVGELFRFGTPPTGLQFQDGNSVQPQAAEAYQLAYTLAIFKALGDEEVAAGTAGAADDANTCILRYCGNGTVAAADLATAKATMSTWGEYSGGPTGRGEQWWPLRWALRNA